MAKNATTGKKWTFMVYMAGDNNLDGNGVTGLGEMKAVMAAAKKAVGHKLDLLGMDACLMSMAEVACQVRASVQYSVGSEQTKPMDGWPYDTLLGEPAKQPAMQPNDLSSVIVDNCTRQRRHADLVESDAFQTCHRHTGSGGLCQNAPCLLPERTGTLETVKGQRLGL